MCVSHPKFNGAECRYPYLEQKTGEIVFHKQNIRDSNIIELLKDMFTANLHPVGKMEFYRGLDLLKVK